MLSMTMTMTRRSLLIAGAALAASAQAKGTPLTAGDVIDRIKAKISMPWRPDTVDRIVAGDPLAKIAGIAVTMMATLDVLQRAVRAGTNMVITHEPTFYSHFDATDALQRDPTFQAKERFIKNHDVVVFRFHDHWHGVTPDGIDVGMARKLGWQDNAGPVTWQFKFPGTPLGAFARTMALRLNAHSMRVVGDPALPIRGVATNWGYASLMPDLIEVAERPDVDLLIVGETREWELVEFIEDQISSGAKKGLIVLNHVVSEQAGMEYFTDWLRPLIPERPVVFVPTREPFWSPAAI
jgi:putative NIF3 family GTP cyclohydrolase 1 type 2